MSNRRRVLLLLMSATVAGTSCEPPTPPTPQLRVARWMIEEAQERRAAHGITTFGFVSLNDLRKPVMAASRATTPRIDCPEDLETEPRHRTCVVGPPAGAPRAAAWIIETAPIATLRRLAKEAAGRTVPRREIDLRRRVRVVIEGTRPGETPGEAEMPAWLTQHLRAWPAPYVPARDYLSKPFEVPIGTQLAFAVGIEEPAWYVGGEPVVFEVEARSPEGVVQLYRHIVDPAARPDDRRWHEARVPLDRIAGRTVRFRFKVRSASGSQLGAQLPVWGDPTVLTPAPAAAPRRPSVVLVSLDTLRAKSTSTFGCDLPTTPFLDGLATKSTRLANAFTTYPNTFGSHMSMLTGAYPSTHAQLGERWALSSQIETLAERLRAAGYTAAAFTEDALLDARAGFERGFSHYWENKSVEPGIGDAPGTFARGLAWLEANRDRPVFLFLHTYAVHGPYEPSAPYDTLFLDAPQVDFTERILSHMNGVPDLAGDREAIIEWLKASHLAYEQEIRQLDDDVAAMVARLDDLMAPDETLLVVTADHGEEFGEHGAVSHVQLYDEVLHVPLLLRWPGHVPPARSLDAVVSLVDLPSTILELLGLAHETRDGRSLAAFLRGDVDTEPRSVVLAEAPPTKWSDGTWSFVARSTAGKCFALGDSELDRCYDLRADPTEQTAIGTESRLAALYLAARAFADDAAAARSRAHPLPASPESDPHADPERERKLRALGYIE